MAGEAQPKIGIIGDGFMNPGFFRKALEAQPGLRKASFKELELGWPISVTSTKKDPDLPIGEFVGRPEDYFDFISDLDVLVTHLAPVTADSLDHAPDLKVIGVSRGGPVNIDSAAAARRGVVAETRNLVRGHMNVLGGAFKREFYHIDHVGPELCELTLGIIGYGDIGMRVARLAAAFGCRIIVSDPFKELTEEDRALGIEKVALDALISTADVVTLHPRVTPETRGMIDRSRIESMKKGAYIVNTTRGEVLDYDALYDALKSGHLSGAALDTFNPEPPPADWPLLKLPNVTLSPHIAGASRYSVVKAANMIAEDVARFFDGETPFYQVR